jgi:hypothetical protein
MRSRGSYLLRSVFAVALGVPLLCMAADKSCAAVNKAGDLALKQTRIHHSADMMRPTVPKPGDKFGALGEKLMHTIIIDKSRFTALDGVTFSADAVKDAEEIATFTGLVFFQMIDEGCRSLGKVTIAGKVADVYEQGITKTADDVLFKFWIDSKTGLPLRATENTPSPELKGMAVTKDRKPKIDVQLSKTERVVTTIAYVFGDAVKPPKLSGPKNLFGQKGEMDAGVEATLRVLIKG